MSAAAELIRNRFANPGADTSPCTDPNIVASAVAMTAPQYLCTRVSGTAAMTTIGLPWPDFDGFIIFIPTAVFTFATGGAAMTTLAAPIGLAGSAVVGKALHFVLMRSAGLWYPSYIA